MKTLIQLLKFFSTALLCGMLFMSCSPDEPEIPGPGDSINSLSINADTISNHLQFYNATQIQGTIPNGPASSSLKISFEDTLYLTDELKAPIKFLHEDITENVAGVYIQVHGAAIGGTGGVFNASYYYDVPESQEAADSDTVSVIMIGVEPDGLINTDGVPPAGGPLVTEIITEITLVPYDEGGQPIAKATRPVKIEEANDDPNGNNGSCGLVLPQDDFWDWRLSYIQNPDSDDDAFSFWNDPELVFGRNGQDIKGNCCERAGGKESVYGFCSIGDTTLNASLHFATYYQIQGETFVFSDNGTYTRNTLESTAVPVPGESNFCGSDPGVVTDRIDHITYIGNWTLSSIALPPDLGGGTSDYLTLQTTFSNGLGYGNPGGIIYQLDCEVLILIQIDREGFGQHLYKFYKRRSPGDAKWYPFA